MGSNPLFSWIGLQRSQCVGHFRFLRQSNSDPRRRGSISRSSDCHGLFKTHKNSNRWHLAVQGRRRPAIVSLRAMGDFHRSATTVRTRIAKMSRCRRNEIVRPIDICVNDKNDDICTFWVTILFSVCYVAEHLSYVLLTQSYRWAKTVATMFCNAGCMHNELAICSLIRVRPLGCWRGRQFGRVITKYLHCYMKSAMQGRTLIRLLPNAPV